MKQCHFSGWATRNDLLCGDGRTIRRNAFKDNDGVTVPLVWNHNHSDLDAVLGHALLENRDEGVYAYCSFNDTKDGQLAKELVEHGDVRCLSIYANKLKQIGNDVIHGSIREVSLVHAGANPGAYIDFIMAHSDDDEDGLIANYDENSIVIYHSDKNENNEKDEKEKPMAEDNKVEKPENEETVKDVFDTLNEKQKKVVYALIGAALEEKENEEDDSEGGNKDMKHNAFDQNDQNNENVISHSEMVAVIEDAKKHGSMRESAIAHGMTNIGELYPYSEGDGRLMTKQPGFIGKKDGWVEKVKNSVHHVPFSRIKALFADITVEEARARGYIKGNQKKEEVFALLKRTTSPQTVYKLQKMDRDDVIDITDFDVIAFLKGEMRYKLDEELCRAYLVGDGRVVDADDKIKEEHIRPIWTDDDLYAIHSVVNVAADATLAQVAEEFIDEAVRSREDYDGSGSPTAYMPEALVSACLLLKDKNGRRIYKDVNELATAMLVKEIVSVPPMKNLTRTDKEGKTRTLRGIIVNLDDYTVGADKGGEINMFDDFDINFNKYEYLIETRASASLMKPKSAIVLETVSE